MRISAQLNQVATTLDVWCRTKGGVAVVASDPFEMLGMLQNKPGGLRAVVMFTGENKRGEYEEAGFVDRNFAIVVSRGRALTLEPGASLTVGSANGDPLFDLAESARDVIRGLSFDAETTEVTPNYTGTEALAVDGKRLDAYQLNFQIGTQLPAIEIPDP